MAAKRNENDVSREEDFRDYDDRNIDEGWPYDDAAGAKSRPVDNTAYGSGANFDEERNGGYKVHGTDADGQQDRLTDAIKPATDGLEDSDDIEERASEALENLEDVDMNSIDLHVHGGTLTIEGAVDDAQTSRRIVGTLQSIKGVRTVINNLRLNGVDGRIPDED